MKIDNSNERYSIIIAGILFTILASVFVASILGFGLYDTYDQNSVSFDNEKSIITFKDDSKITNSSKKEKINDVPVHYRCELNGLDTVKGKIKCVDGYIDPVLELCFCDDNINDWYITFASYGGYKPDLANRGYIEVWQGKPCKQLAGTIMVDTWKLIGTAPCPCCCCGDCVYELWMVNFTVENCFMIDSNRVPTQVDECPNCPWSNCWEFPEQHDPSQELNKRVDLEFYMNWEGCPRPDQDFSVILVHKVVFWNPQLPLNNKIFIAC